jgi:hypothetical protein
LIKASDAYIAKAGDNLKDILDEAGFAEPDETVKKISALEEKTAEILAEQTEMFDKKLAEIENPDEIPAMVEEFEAEDSAADKISELYREEFAETIPKLSNVYLQKIDGGLIVEKIRTATSAWIDSFSAKLGSWIGEYLMNSVKPVLFYGVQSGEGIAEITAKIYDKNYHEHYYQARRIAITEVLRAHSVAQQEAVIQNPAVEYKEWVHTGSYRNEPRDNHEKMNGVTARKDEPFQLLGEDKVLYAPMFPRDDNLPPSESVNCHCIHRGIVNEDILGLPLAERKRLQDEAVARDNANFTGV